MKRIFIILALSIVALTPISAYKKQMSQVRTLLKAGKELNKAEQLMQKVLADSNGRKDIKAWLLMYDVIKVQYDQGNERLYLKQQYDTAAIFRLTAEMFNALKGVDSLESVKYGADETQMKYRRKHAELLNTYRQNLYNGGMFHLNKKNYNEAYRYFADYINCAYLPMFKAYRYDETDALVPQAAYWTVFCGYKLTQHEKALKYIALAVKDKEHYQLLLQYLAEIYMLQGTTARYIEMLKVGFNDYPTQPFFYTRLIEHYSADGDWTAADQCIDRARRFMPQNRWLQTAKTTTLLNLGQYDACIALCDSIISQAENVAEVNLNAGLSYFNQAVELERDIRSSRNKKKQIQDIYRRALPYMERFRQLNPEQKSLWMMPLYTIYLNLNMGKEFEEIDRMIKDKNK